MMNEAGSLTLRVDRKDISANERYKVCCAEFVSTMIAPHGFANCLHH